MSKRAKENEEDENITVSKVYETLKSGPFLKKLYWDLLSDIKEKPTYKHMKETTEKLLTKKLESISKLSDNDSDDLMRKTIVTEICSMTYAIDTVYSKILFIKLQKEYESHICDIIKDLRKEGKITDSVWAKLKFSNGPQVADSGENSSSAKSSPIQIPCQSAAQKQLPIQKQETSNRCVTRKHKMLLETPNRRMTRKYKIQKTEIKNNEKEIRSSIHEDIKKINNEGGKVDVPLKDVKPLNQATSKQQTSTPIKRAPKKRLTKENHIPIQSNPVTKNNKSKKDIPKEELQVNEPDSDAESEISVGHVSIASVSSVHTSDLSSFDDEISLSSEDEDNGKKRLSLKDLQEFCHNGKFSTKISDKLNGIKFENAPGSSKGNPDKKAVASIDQQTERSPVKKAVTSNDQQTEASSADDSGEFNSNQSPTQKLLPKRIRKPNSKYSSEDIVCTMTKEKRKQSAVAANEKRSSGIVTPARKKMRARNEVMNLEAEGESSKILDNDIIVIKEEIEIEDIKNPSQKCDSSDLYKHQTAVRSLTSRRTAPLMLYST